MYIWNSHTLSYKHANWRGPDFPAGLLLRPTFSSLVLTYKWAFSFLRACFVVLQRPPHDVWDCIYQASVVRTKTGVSPRFRDTTSPILRKRRRERLSAVRGGPVPREWTEVEQCRDHRGHWKLKVQGKCTSPFQEQLFFCFVYFGFFTLIVKYNMRLEKYIYSRMHDLKIIIKQAPL